MRKNFWRGTALLAALVLLGSAHVVGSAAPNKLVLAFYYPWYDQNTWKDAVVIDRPLDRYNSSDAGAMARQIAQAKGAQIDGFVSAWYGPQMQGNQTETNLRTLLGLAQPQGFSIGVLLETDGPFLHSSGDVQNALVYLLREHASKPAYLRWNGKPVIFFWAQNRYPRATWQSIRNQVDPNHNSIWIAEGFDMSLMGIFDGDFVYNIAWAEDTGPSQRQWAARTRAQNALWVGTVMPGWDDTRLVERPKRYKRERDNGGWYQRTWASAASANPELIVITSWNEFVENTYIEPSTNFGAAYLDLTRTLAVNWKASPNSAPQPAPQSAPAAVPTATPVPRPTALPTATPKPPPPRAPVECSLGVQEFCVWR